MLEIANPIKRLFAVLIDICVLVPCIIIIITHLNSILSLPVTLEFEDSFTIKLDEWGKRNFWKMVIIYSIAKLFIVFLYFAMSEASAWQGSIGKRMVKIKVTDMDGNRISLKRSSVRLLSKILSAQLMLGYVLILFTQKKQGLHDLIAKTLVQQLK